MNKNNRPKPTEPCVKAQNKSNNPELTDSWMRAQKRWQDTAEKIIDNIRSQKEDTQNQKEYYGITKL